MNTLVKNTMVLGGTIIGIMGMVGGALYLTQPVIHRQAAREVGYEHPENVVDVKYENLNKEARKSNVVLILKDGRKLTYIDKGYELQK